MVGDRARGRLSLPGKRAIPTLKDYSKGYLELIKNSAKENTLLAKQRAINALVSNLGNYRIDTG